MQHVKGEIYYIPKEKHSPDDENMSADLVAVKLNFCLAVTVITLRALGYLTLAKKTTKKRKKERNRGYQQKTQCETKEMKLQSFLSFIQNCCERLPKPPQWDCKISALLSAKASSSVPIAMEKTKEKSLDVEKCQQNHSTEATSAPTWSH